MTNTSHIIIVPFNRPDKMDMDFYPELDSKMLSSQDPETYHELREIRKPGHIRRYSKEFQSWEDNKWIKQRNDSEPLHPILALYEDRNPIKEKFIKSKNRAKQTLTQKKGSIRGNNHLRNVIS